MQTHVAQLTKQRLSDFFVKEDGHVAHKNTLVAGNGSNGCDFRITAAHTQYCRGRYLR